MYYYEPSHTEQETHTNNTKHPQLHMLGKRKRRSRSSSKKKNQLNFLWIFSSILNYYCRKLDEEIREDKARSLREIK